MVAETEEELKLVVMVVELSVLLLDVPEAGS